MKNKSVLILSVFLATSAAWAKDSGPATQPAASRPTTQAASAPAVSATQPAATQPFLQAAATMHKQLEDSQAELARLREDILKEKVPLSRKLTDLESELSKVRQEYQQVSRLLDSRTLDLSNLRTEVKARQDEAGYLSNLLGEYTRNFESCLHIAELQRYREPLKAATLAAENTSLSREEVYKAQALLVAASLERLEDALGGTRFEGSAVDANGVVRQGTFVLVGPVAIFGSSDGQAVGAAEQRLGSLEPAVIQYTDADNSQAASQVVSTSTGLMPMDPTLGNAHKIESTKETLWEHILKGGAVMWPILALAAAALLVALYKWFDLSRVWAPKARQIEELLAAVSKRNIPLARQKAQAMRGPVGQMLCAGIDHLREPRELIEEAMYEVVLIWRLKLQKMLPFVALSASSAPLLGLLGTVTGIITTFKLITVYGSGDVKTLSAGISEALITTEWGLIVAIPSLLMYAFLSRKARGAVDAMEKAAVAFMIQVGKTHLDEPAPAPKAPAEEPVEAAV